MPRYTIGVLDPLGAKPGGSGITHREERPFANLGAAMARGREMYEAHKGDAIGFRICNAAGELLHEWRR